jgi:hypothetical protein
VKRGSSITSWSASGLERVVKVSNGELPAGF